MNQQPRPQFLRVTTEQGSTVFVNVNAIRRAEYFPPNENGGSMLFLDTPGGQATSLEAEADALWELLQPLAVEPPAQEPAEVADWRVLEGLDAAPPLAPVWVGADHA